MFYVSLMVLKGINFYWNVVLILSRGRIGKWRGTDLGDLSKCGVKLLVQGRGRQAAPGSKLPQNSQGSLLKRIHVATI